MPSFSRLSFLLVAFPLVASATTHLRTDGDAGQASDWPWIELRPSEVPKVERTDWVTNPIDAFVLAKLEAHELEPASPASPRARLRRLYFGLIGVPPRPEDLQAFLDDPSPEAYREEVEKLLDDPGYGERWGRHWLDLVRYADSAGGGTDFPRPHMWRYRDYVVRAFNQDRPYDRFIREQLAGDAFSGYGDEGRLGLGFLHQWVNVSKDTPQQRRRDFLNDVVGVTGSVFLGMTVECARCHDHKFDPIPTLDYYRIEAFFAPAQVSTAAIPFSEYEAPGLDSERWKAREQAWKDRLGERKKWQDARLEEFKERIRKRRVLASSADLKDLVVDVSKSELKTTVLESDLFSPEEQRTYELISRQSARFVNPNHPGYFEPKAYTISDSPLSHFVATHVLTGGDFQLREDPVEPGFLTAVTGNSDDVDLTGLGRSRRKLLAEWIASSQNPLTARVMVNRIWHYHFGKGLVATTSDFGKNGSGTVQSELIDWLATRFIESGWSIKDMHRLIVTSSVYQQSMKHPRAKEFETVDPQNQYLWVRDAVRLEAEVIRDNLLAVSGELNRDIGGPPFFPEVDDAVMRRAPTWWDPSPPEERHRRTIYMLKYRSLELPFLKAFDSASPNLSCPVRETTSVTPQVFSLFNSKFVLERSQALADRIRVEVGDDLDRQIEQAFQWAFQRLPSDRERERCLSFLDRSRDSIRTRVLASASAGASPAELSDDDRLTDLCLVLLNSNEFVFLE